MREVGGKTGRVSQTESDRIISKARLATEVEVKICREVGGKTGRS